MLTRDLAHDLKKYNSVAFAVHPGYVKTEMNPDGDQTSDEAAEKIINLIGKLNKADSGGYFDNQGNKFPR